jgi:excisionase family DNA binding protein
MLTVINLSSLYKTDGRGLHPFAPLKKLIRLHHYCTANIQACSEKDWKNMQDTESRVIQIQRLLYSLEQASEVLGGLGRTSIFELIKAGELKVVRIGRRTFISESALTDFVQRSELKSEASNAVN